jgi:hypothetical protein
MRPILTITTRNSVADEYDDGDYVGEEEEEEEEEEAYLNLLPMGAHRLKEKRKRRKDISTRRWNPLAFDRCRDILLSSSLPRLLHYFVTILLAVTLLSIVFFGRRGSRGGVTMSYVRTPPSLTQLT